MKQWRPTPVHRYYGIPIGGDLPELDYAFQVVDYPTMPGVRGVFGWLTATATAKPWAIAVPPFSAEVFAERTRLADLLEGSTVAAFALRLYDAGVIDPAKADRPVPDGHLLAAMLKPEPLVNGRTLDAVEADYRADLDLIRKKLGEERAELAAFDAIAREIADHFHLPDHEAIDHGGLSPLEMRDLFEHLRDGGAPVLANVDTAELRELQAGVDTVMASMTRAGLEAADAAGIDPTAVEV